MVKHVSTKTPPWLTTRCSEWYTQYEYWFDVLHVLYDKLDYFQFQIIATTFKRLYKTTWYITRNSDYTKTVHFPIIVEFDYFM